jgi:hypothetical protein
LLAFTAPSTVEASKAKPRPPASNTTEATAIAVEASLLIDRDANDCPAEYKPGIGLRRSDGLLQHFNPSNQHRRPDV